jgi:hypothetical protein
MLFWLGTNLFQRRSRPSSRFPHRMMIMFTYDFSPLNLCDFASLRENFISFFGFRSRVHTKHTTTRFLTIEVRMS